MSSPTQLPPYVAGAANPFPTRDEVKVQAEVVVAEVDPNALRDQQKGEILEEARRLIEGNKSFTANIDNLAFGGYVEGIQGKRILHRGQWLKHGDRIAVTIKGGSNVYQLLDRLKEFDAELAQKMIQDFDTRIAKGKTELTVTSIGKDKVVLSEGKRTYEVPWRASRL